MKTLKSLLLSLCMGFIGAYAENTDVSKLDNTVYIESTTVEPGSQIVLSLKMKNNVMVTGFQCKLYLPEGMTVPKDEDDYLMVNLSTARTTARKTDIFNAVTQSDGSVMILASSTTSKTFTGTDGEVATITLDVASTAGNGDDTAILKEIVLSDAAGTSYESADVSFTIKVMKTGAVTIKAKDYTIEYGDELPAFEYTSEGATLEGTPVLTCEATRKSVVGTYPIVVSKGSVTNENLTLVNGILTITKAPLKITAKSYTRKQGEENPMFEVDYEGFKNSETSAMLTKLPTLTCSAMASSAPGEYDIVPSGAEAQNYEISYVNGTLTVNAVGGESATAKTVNVSVAGTLSNYISESEKYSIEELTITGPINGTDIKLIRDMAGCDYQGNLTNGKVRKLDISGTRLVAGGEMYLDADYASFAPGYGASAGHFSQESDNILGKGAFMCCQFESIVLPNSITAIDDDALDHCVNLVSVIVPEGVKSINFSSFSSCDKLTSVSLPSTLTSIGRYAFSHDSNLSTINIPEGIETIDDATFYGCKSLDNINLPKSLKRINSQVFVGCSSLSEIEIPQGVLDIGYQAFYDCPKLKSITSMSRSPFAIYEVFDNFDATLYVPSGTKALYQQIEGWKKFQNIVEMDSESPSLNVTQLTIDGDFIVGTVHTASFSAENNGGDYDGELYLCAKEVSNGNVAVMPILNGETFPSGTDFTTSIMFVLDSPGLYQFWVETSIDNIVVSDVVEINATSAAKLTALNYTREYGEDNPEFGYNADKGGFSGEPQITCSATAMSPVGTYPIVISQGSVDNNYVTYVNGTLTITKAPLTITAKSYTRKQGEENPTFEVEYEGFKNNETSAVLTKQPTLTCSATISSESGEYDIEVSDAEAKNYDISYVKGTLTVTQDDAIIITARNYTIEYGDAIPTFEYTVEGATLDGTPTLTCEATSSSSVGTYPIVIKKGSVTNYNDTYVNGTLTITKAPLMIAAGEYTITEWDNLPDFKPTYTGFKNNETEAVLTTTPIISCTATNKSAPGEYYVSISGAEAQNYDITYIAGKLTIIDNPNKINDGGNVFVAQKNGTVALINANGVSGNYEIPKIVTHNGDTYLVTSIGESAFEGNTSLTEVTIPASIISIGGNAFAGCTNLKKIYLNVVTPIDITSQAARTRAGGSSVFDGVDKENCILYVPDESVNAYKAADGWKEFKQILGMSASSIRGIALDGEPQDVYNMRGQKVRAKATSLDGLPNGVYIINGKKVVK